jgi:hypothetical protein
MSFVHEASALVLLAVGLLACGGGDAGGSGGGADAGHPADAGHEAGLGKLYALTGTIAFTTDAEGAPFRAQNGSTAHVPASDLAGKLILWLTTTGGDPVGNAKPIDIGGGPMGADLTASFTTPVHYANGPWELALFISVSGMNPTMGPQPGDLAAFSLANPPPGDPPITGVSIRMDVHDGDASIALTNDNFIRF